MLLCPCMAFLDLFLGLFGKEKRVTRKTIAQYKQDLLVNAGKEQFQSLLKKNIRIPVVLL